MNESTEEINNFTVNPLYSNDKTIVGGYCGKHGAFVGVKCSKCQEPALGGDKMTNDDLTRLNREVAEWLKLLHKPDGICEEYGCSCGIWFKNRYRLNLHIAKKNKELPDFILRPDELLRELMKCSDWQLFGRTVGETLDDHEWNILVKYVTDQTGLLLMKVGEYPAFREWREK